jgi:exosortase
MKRGTEILGSGAVVALSVALGAWCLRLLLPQWRQDPSLSHSPLLVLIALVLLLRRRGELRLWEASDRVGLAALGICALLEIGAGWGDVVFLQPLAFLGMIIGTVWYLGGRSTASICAGPLGLLAFTIPWPTTLISALAFPMQLISSSYAALFAGMLGLSIHREGVHVSVLSESGDKPIYSMLVAQQCSGLTSLMVLLAFGYLVAYFTPVQWWFRLLLTASVIPMALFANALRLTIILLVGGLASPAWAGWVHDREQPVLIFFCSFGLLGLRQWMLSVSRRSLSQTSEEAPT